MFKHVQVVIWIFYHCKFVKYLKLKPGDHGIFKIVSSIFIGEVEPLKSWQYSHLNRACMLIIAVDLLIWKGKTLNKMYRQFWIQRGELIYLGLSPPMLYLLPSGQTFRSYIYLYLCICIYFYRICIEIIEIGLELEKCERN